MPTKTTNKIHFTDLEPTRFEDLCLALLYPLLPWSDIRHYGRMGSDGGVDIMAIEKMEDGIKRNWFVQCRRYKTVNQSVLKKAVDDCLEKAKPDVLLIVVANDVSKKAHEFFTEYTKKKGVPTSYLWTASILEAKLYSERKDLLFSYFGISDITKSRFQERSLSRNISLKKRLHKEFLKDPKEVDWEKVTKNSRYRFEYREVIVHSIDDEFYPDIDKENHGISGWFKLELFDFYYNGIEFIINVEEGILDEQGNWAVIKYKQKIMYQKQQ